jgi:hypothetical protein
MKNEQLRRGHLRRYGHRHLESDTTAVSALSMKYEKVYRFDNGSVAGLCTMQPQRCQPTL